MHLSRLDIAGFKSFAKKTSFDFNTSVVAIVGPNGSGKSNVAEAVRFVLGEQSMKSMRGKRGEDMIWNGSNTAPRANRGSVSIVFDNKSHFLNVDFDEVTVERVVNRDGTNEYRLNGSQVRLKDIFELLAGANIGQTGHHIISQGEADKILSANPRERREMLEDALGLKVYQYKLEESERKLEKTAENMRQVEALRREIAPHLKFLKKQVERVEKARELRESAVVRFRAYFKREEQYLKLAHQHLDAEASHKNAELSAIAAKVADAKKTLADSAEDKRGSRILELSKALDDARASRAEAARKSARLEGRIEAVEKTALGATLPAGAVSRLLDEGESALTRLGSGSASDLLAFFREYLGKLKKLVTSAENPSEDLALLRAQKEEALVAEKGFTKKETELSAQLEKIRTELDAARLNEREKERALFELTADEREIRHAISAIESERERVSLEEAEFERELAEAATLIGREILSYQSADISSDVSRDEQVKEKRELEKTKIRLEEMGAGGGEDVMKEFEEATDREAFLEKELADLASASESLKKLIVDLEKELGIRFTQGLDAINAEFTKLFALMFDGGSASLVRIEEKIRHPRMDSTGEDEDHDGIADDEEETVEGIDISLSIPRKRVKSLVMLSGGERALTSIALIFAMSSVNPPPFLVLDETDAALDESNSRRYGDMVESLAKKSQLIVITHNRETMSRAGILYGVTMGNDGVSKVLSVKLEEAVKVAK
ncbi:AAA family ATPase [Candidatus Kaiserbacteria bacterium]|nr:AAA family ATPase [Candidatus Kaiserbacteria bacterium]